MKTSKTIKTLKYKGFIIKVKENECWIYGNLGPFPAQWAASIVHAKKTINFLTAPEVVVAMNDL